MPTDHFNTEHFSMVVSSREHFGMCTIQRCRRSGRWIFQHENILTWRLFGTGTFRHEEFSAQEYFGTGTFRHMDISAQQYRCRNVHITLQGAKISMCWNVQVPKYPCAEMFRCQKFLMPKIPCAENSPCQNVLALKSPSAGTSAAPNSACAKMFL